MLVQQRSLSMVRRQSPNEFFVDGGPARSKALDRESFERLERQFGGIAGVRRFAKSTGAGVGDFMGADWLATDVALYYINYNADGMYRWPWDQVKSISEVGSGMLGRTRHLRVETDSRQVEISIPRIAAASLLRIATAAGLG